MKNRTRFAILAMATVMACTAVSGCGSKESAKSTAGGGSEAAAATSADALNFGCFSYSDSLDPAAITNSSWCLTRYGIGECLFRFNDDMTTESWLCDSYEVSEDHKTWKFHIRDGVKFSNGNAVTPSAVQASIERMYRECDTENGGTGTAAPKSYMEYESMEADDESGVLTIVTKEAYADLTGILAYPYYCVVDVSAEEEGRSMADEGPVATGPYAVDEFQADQFVEMSANEYYWNGEVPYEHVKIMFIDDDNTKAMALQNGDIDVVENITSASLLESIENDEAYHVSKAPGGRVGFAMINQEGVLGNDALRQAIIMALDHETMCDVTVGGMYTAGCSILPSSLDYNYDQLTDPFAYDVDAAVKLLDEAGITDSDGDGYRELDGTMIDLNYITYPSRNLSDFAEAVAVSLDSIGIKVSVNTTDADTEWNLMAAGEYDLADGNWNTVTTGDPTSFLANWYSKSESNYGKYLNEEYDKVYETLLGELDLEKRVEGITKLQQYLIDDAAVLVHGYYNSSMSSSAKVTGAEVATADYYWLSTAIRPAQ